MFGRRRGSATLVKVCRIRGRRSKPQPSDANT
jgi:hypothetical protein